MDDQAEVRETLNGEHYDTVPAIITAAWVKGLGKSLEAATWKGQQALKQLLPPRSVAQILAQAVVLAKGEPTLVEVLLKSFAASRATKCFKISTIRRTN